MHSSTKNYRRGRYQTTEEDEREVQAMPIGALNKGDWISARDNTRAETGSLAGITSSQHSSVAERLHRAEACFAIQPKVRVNKGYWTLIALVKVLGEHGAMERYLIPTQVQHIFPPFPPTNLSKASAR